MKVSIGAKRIGQDAWYNNALYHWYLVSGDGLSLCEPFFPDQCKYVFSGLRSFIQLGRRLEASFDAQVSRI